MCGTISSVVGLMIFYSSISTDDGVFAGLVYNR